MGQGILIVEDDAGWRSEIVGVLSGYELTEASSIQEAWQKIDEAHSKSQPIDLVILDLGLSATTGIDSGLAVLAHLKEQMPEVPCIVFTGRELPMGTAASLFEEYRIFKGLEKPRDMPRLAQVVRAALAQGDTQKESERVEKPVEKPTWSVEEDAGPAFRRGYALVIGVANYPHVRRLPMTVLQDARDVTALLRDPGRCGYPADQVHPLLDEAATAAAIRDGLRWLAQATQAGDTALIFFSGHGGRIESGAHTDAYLVPHDAEPSDLVHTAISGDELTALLRQIHAGRLVVIIDACHAGGTGEPKGSAHQGIISGLNEEIYDRLAQGSGRVIIASSRTDEVSSVLPGMANSVFTHYLLEALDGQARTRGDGLIRVFDVFDYISEKVPQRAAQHPIFKAADLDNNFPIALYFGDRRDAPAGSPAWRRTAVDKRALRQAIVAAFNLEELETLCADVEQDLFDDGINLAVDLEIVGGKGKTVQVLRLIDYLDRRGNLDYLVRAVRRQRSGIV